MAVRLRNGEHHRNPTGFYNKVKYLLRESKRDLDKLNEIYENIIWDIYNHYAPMIECSWKAAYTAAKWMILDNTIIDNPKDYLNSIYIHDRENRPTWYEKLCLK